MKTRADVNAKLDALLAKARDAPPMTKDEVKAQMISFAFGNASFENPLVTKAMVEDAHNASKED